MISHTDMRSNATIQLNSDRLGVAADSLMQQKYQAVRTGSDGESIETDEARPYKHESRLEVTHMMTRHR